MDRADIGADNKTDVKASDKAHIRSSNGVGVTMGLHSEDGVVGRVESEVDTGNSYGLDLLISEDNHAENLPFCNLTDVLANLFGDLSPTSIDFCSSPIFPNFSSYPTTSDGTSVRKPLNSTSFGGPATCNPGIILAFHY